MEEILAKVLVIKKNTKDQNNKTIKQLFRLSVVDQYIAFWQELYKTLLLMI